jgi:AcrR family transcriptional regulator
VTLIIDTRSRLLDIAAEQFLRVGYAETTLRTIAAAAGVKAGSIYYHFASKEEMLAEVLDEGIARIAASLDQAVAGVDDPRRAIASAVRAHLHALFEHGAYTACHVRVFPHAPPEVKAAATVARDAYEARWQELLERADRAGALRVDPHTARLFLLGALNATVDWRNPDRQPIDQLADAFIELFLEGAFASERGTS